MPKLPIYNSQRQVSAEKDAVFRDETEQTFAPMRELAKTGAEIVSAWQKTSDTIDLTKAKSEYSIGAAQIKAEAAADPNYDNKDIYQRRLNKLKEESLSGIANREVRDQVSYDFDVSNVNATVDIGNDFRKKKLEAGQNILYGDLEVSRNEFIQEADSVKKQGIKQTALAEVDLNRQNNVITSEQARAEKKKINENWEKNWQDNQIQKVVSENPEEAERMITKGAFGKLSPDDKANWLEIANKRKKQLKAEDKKNIKRFREDQVRFLDQKYFDGTLNMLDILQAAEIPEEVGGIPKSDLKKMRDDLLKKQAADTEAIYKNEDTAVDYINVINEVLNVETDKSLARGLLIEAYREGLLPEEETFLNELKTKTEDYQASTRVGWEKIFNWGRKYTPDPKKAATDLRTFLLESYKGQKLPDEIAQNIIDNKKKNRYPQLQGFEKGNTYNFPYVGTVSIIGEDDDGMIIIRRENE